MILGTAGHIDHGKTALIKALTGCDTDRLKEEKERGISIDLGFAHYDLPGGERLGVVDVPGHERFIKNMLAGAHGIDLVLFTVAADDGVMPQSEEHLDILHLLGAESAIFVITKIDLVSPKRVREVEEEIGILSLGTCLEGSPIVPVSSMTGAGLGALNRLIREKAERRKTLQPPGYFRLPVDRSFILQGHGHVVTGTAWSGEVHVGDRLRVMPGGHLVRVRTIQVHNESVPKAGWGNRIALNLVALDRGEVSRGDVVCHDRYTLTTTRCDARIELRPGAGKRIKSHEQVRVHVGTFERLARLVLLEGRERLHPKEAALCQLVFEEPTFVLRGDRFIIRNETAEKTLGGGVILDPFAQKHKGSERGIGADLEGEKGEPFRFLEGFLNRGQEFSYPVSALFQAVNLSEAEVERTLAGSKAILSLPGETEEKSYTTQRKWEFLQNKILEEIRQFHLDHPLAPGEEMEELRAGLPYAIHPRVFREIAEGLEQQGKLRKMESLVSLTSHQVKLGIAEVGLAQAVLTRLEQDPLSPPDLKQIAADLGQPGKLFEVIRLLENEGKIVRVTQDLCFKVEALHRAKTLLLENLEQKSEISAAAFRTLIGSSRKYAISLLEYFDRQGLTLRVGDVRRLRASKIRAG